MLGLSNSVSGSSYTSLDLKEGTTDLELWLKNDTGVTTAKWDDSSGNDNHVTQGTEADQAAVSGGGLDFEASESDHYDLTSKIDIADNQGFCIALVLTRESEVAGCLLSDGTAELLQFQTARKIRVKTVNTSGEGIVTDIAFTSDVFALSTKFLLLINRSAGAQNQFTVMKNGVTLTPDTDTSANEAKGENPSGIEFTVLGARDGSNNFFDGIVHEAAIWSKGLSTTEIADVNSYLKEIHGL
mgnify:CR=1 FL=1